MANIKANQKSIIKQSKATIRNRATRSALRTAVKKVLKQPEFDAVKARNASIAIKNIDKAVAKGVLHKNTGARTKSRMLKHLDKNLPTKIR